MTTDIERELRELFREKAGEAPVATFNAPTAAPQEVLRRGRRRQVGTVLGSAAIVLVLIVGSVAGLNALLRGDEDPFTTGDYHVFERTATIEAFTVTSPSDWYLVNEWPLSTQLAVGSGSSSGECTAAAPGAGQPSPVCTNTEQSPQAEALPQGLPMFQLSNMDAGLDAVACSQGLSAGAAVLYVGLDYQRAIFGAKDPSIAPWPVELGEPEAAGGPCGAGRYASFSVNGQPFFAWVGFGADVTDADRSTALAAYASMTVDDAWAPVPPEELTPAYVIAGGTAETGDVWRLEVRPGEQSPQLALSGTNQALPGEAIPGTLLDRYYSADPTDPIFGTVTKVATGVEFRPGTESVSFDLGQTPVAGTLVPIPPTLGSFDFDLFFIDPPEGYALLGGQIIALGVDRSATVSPTPAADPRGKAVNLSGSLLGQDWSARFTGAFADESACIYVKFDTPFEPLCPGQVDTSLAGEWPSLHGTLGTRLFLLAGSVPTTVDTVRFTSDNGTQPPSQFRCQMGPLGWTDPDKKVCAIALPPEGSGTLQYLDANGVVLFEEGNGWGSATAATSEWAVAQGSAFGQRWDLVMIRGGNQSPRLVLRGPDGETFIEIRPQHLEEGRGLAARQYAIVDQADSTRWTTMVFGLADPSANQVSIALETGQVLQASLRNRQVSEPWVWWVFVDGSVRGEIVAITTDCREVARTTFATESASRPSPSPSIPTVECLGP